MNKDLLDYYTQRIAEELKEDDEISEGVIRELLKDYATTEYVTDKHNEVKELISEIEKDMGDMDTALDSVIASQESILAIQNTLIGGDT